MILVVNAGSSSIKARIFAPGDLEEVAAASLSEIGSEGVLRVGSRRKAVTTTGHADALALILGALDRAGHGASALTAAGHRVVHGGASLTAPVRIDAETRNRIADCIPLAPLHNPVNLDGIDALTALLPDLPQYASFDTAFHATNAPVSTTYAIPAEARAAGIRRYGFHGLSYAGMVAGFGTRSPAACWRCTSGTAHRSAPSSRGRVWRPRWGIRLSRG